MKSLVGLLFAYWSYMLLIIGVWIPFAPELNEFSTTEVMSTASFFLLLAFGLNRWNI